MSLEQDYAKRYTEALVPIAEALERLLEEYTTDVDRIDRISARAKDVSRFLAKAGKRNKDQSLKYSDPLQEIQDQIGARIITFYLDDVSRIEAQVCPYFKAVEQKDLIPESVNEFSYVGRHFILFLPSDVTSGYDPDLVPKFFELQIKTLFQHAWAEANHDLAYKPPVPMTKQQRRLVAFAAAQAWGADQVFGQLHGALVNMPRVTCETIDQYRGTLKIDGTYLKCDMWDIFDKAAFDADSNARVVPLKNLVSPKDQRLDQKFLSGEKDDPRLIALHRLEKAAAKRGRKRAPLTAIEHADGLLYIVDGNATAQVLMMAQWVDVPVIILSND